MRISLIVAMAENRVMGAGNRLPWRLPADLRHFKDLTMGKPVIMGRRTYDSIGRPLPGRHNIVVTRQRGLVLPGCTVVHSLAEALCAAEPAPEVMVAGGAEIFAEALPMAGRLYLTEVAAKVEGDVFFPAFDRGRWRETARGESAADEKNQYACTFLTLDRTP